MKVEIKITLKKGEDHIDQFMGLLKAIEALDALADVTIEGDIRI